MLHALSNGNPNFSYEQWRKPFELSIRLWKCSRGLSRGLLQTSSRADAHVFFGGCTDADYRGKKLLPSRALSRAVETRALSQKLSRTGAPRTLADVGQSKVKALSNSFMEGFWRRSYAIEGEKHMEESTLVFC